MEIKQQIQNNIKEFIKSGDKLASDTLRMALAAIISKEKEKRYKVFSLREISQSETKEKPGSREQDLIKESELTDEEILVVLLSEVKKRKDAIILYEKGNRQELADKEKKEIEILQKYLPKQLSPEELEKLIKESINKVAATAMQDMGKVMQNLMLKVRGRADSVEVSRIVKELLNK